MKRITIKNSLAVAETFENFLMAKKAKGLAEKTINTYKQHFSAIKKYLNVDIPLDDLRKEDLEMMISEMREADLSANSIKSYSSTLKS